MEDTEPQIIIWLGSYLEHCPLFILRTAFFVWYIFLSFVSWYFSANAFSHNESHQAGPRTTWVPLSFYLPMQILVPEKAQVRRHLPILIPWPCSTLNPFLSCSPDGIIWYIIQYSNVLYCFPSYPPPVLLLPLNQSANCSASCLRQGLHFPSPMLAVKVVDPAVTPLRFKSWFCCLRAVQSRTHPLTSLSHCPPIVHL